MAAQAMSQTEKQGEDMVLASDLAQALERCGSLQQKQDRLLQAMAQLQHDHDTLTQQYTEAQEKQQAMTEQISLLESQLHVQEARLMACTKELEETAKAMEKVEIVCMGDL